MADGMDLSNLSLNDLAENDKKELQQFLQNEASKAKIQLTVHQLSDTCWKKCITGPIKSNTLDSTENACFTNCVDRFVDSQLVVIRHLENLRQGMH